MWHPGTLHLKTYSTPEALISTHAVPTGARVLGLTPLDMTKFPSPTNPTAYNISAVLPVLWPCGGRALFAAVAHQLAALAHLRTHACSCWTSSGPIWRKTADRHCTIQWPGTLRSISIQDGRLGTPGRARFQYIQSSQQVARPLP